MSTSTPHQRPAPDAVDDIVQRVLEALREQALIEEARARARRRRRRCGLAALIAAALGAGALAGIDRGGSDTLPESASRAAPAAVTGGSPALPQPLTYSSDGQVFVVSAGGRRALLTSDRGSLYGVEWSPDGSKLLAFHTPRGSNTSSLVVVGANGHVGPPIAPEAAASPTWSRDGARIAFQQGSDLFVMSSDGKQRRRIATNAVSDGSGGGVSWSTGNRVVFLGTKPRGLYVVPADGSGTPQPIPLSGLGFPAAWISQPVVSPDGSYIAFNGNAAIFVVRPDGTGLRRLAAGLSPSWSPDGTEIAFAGFHSLSNGVVRVDGGGLRRLPGCGCGLRGPGFWPNVTWSSDGSRIAFVSGDGNAVTTVKPDGTGATRVVLVPRQRNHQGPTHPLWQPTHAR